MYKFGPGSTLPCGATVLLRTPQYVLAMWVRGEKDPGRVEYVVWGIDDETGYVEAGDYHYGLPDNPRSDIEALEAALKTIRERAVIL